MEEIPYPSSLQEVESLVQQLYQPGSPQRLVRIQEILQDIQRSGDGWQLANSLLGHADENIRFFGALTYIVKLNTNSKSLSEKDANDLLQNLTNWLIRSLETPGGPLVTKKLCYVLVTYFMHFSDSWTRCVRHIIFSLCAGSATPYGAISDAPETAVLLDTMSNSKALAAVWFCTTLVEEVAKTDSTSMKQNHFHQRLATNVEDVVALISKTLLQNPEAMTTDPRTRQDSLVCYQAWVLYSHRAFVDAAIVLDPLRKLTKSAIACLLQDDLYQIAIELFTDILANYSRFLEKADFEILYTLLSSSWARQRYERLIDGDSDFDSLQFGMFLVAFGDATVQDLTRSLETDPQSRHVLTTLCGLLSAEGYIVNEDRIFVPAVEFWATFVETMIDCSYSETETSEIWSEAASAYLMKAIENCWHKIQFPPTDVFKDWDSAERIAFKDARKDVGDLLQQAYTQTGSSLFAMFVDLILQSLESQAWVELEASLYCLTSLSDCISSDEAVCDALLDKVFGSTIFAMFSSPDSDMPPRVRQSFLDLIAGYPTHFERNTKYLPNALDLLFKAVELLPRLAVTASKSIFSLCSSCRDVLVPELSAFLQEYSRISSAMSLDSLVKEKVTGAIASIIQAITNDSARLSSSNLLLDHIENNFQQSMALLTGSHGQQHQQSSIKTLPDDSRGSYEHALNLCLVALRCMESMAKGLQVPNDVPVDLEIKGESSSFWTSGDGASIQGRTLGIVIAALTAFPDQGEVVETSCQIFRAGFTEHESGPFVFPPAAVTQIFVKFGPQTPRLGYAISTACSLINSQGPSSPGSIDGLVRDLLAWIAQLLQTLGEPANDPEIAQNGIEFLTRLVPKHLDVILALQPNTSLEFLFMFTLKALTGKEVLPKSAAAEFWATLIAVNGQPALQNLLQQLGPLLARALIYNIGGSAARSELDKLSEPLKKLIVNQVRSKTWLEAALEGSEISKDRVPDSERKVFLQKIISLRGARGTNHVVREFWLLCRGSSFAYAS